MPVGILNLPGLRVLDFREPDREYHVKDEPIAHSKAEPRRFGLFLI